LQRAGEERFRRGLAAGQTPRIADAAVRLKGAIADDRAGVLGVNRVAGSKSLAAVRRCTSTMVAGLNLVCVAAAVLYMLNCAASSPA